MARQVYLTTAESAEKASVSITTIYSWCEKYGIGIKVGGRWRVLPNKLKKVLDGTLHKELVKRRERETYNAESHEPDY